MKRAPPDVLVAGEALWDIRVPGGASFDRARSADQGAGGAAVNVALALRRLGRAVAIAARVGDDALGRALRRGLERAGVDTAGLASTELRTGLVLVASEAKSRVVVSYRSASERPAVVPPSGARALVLTGLLPRPGWAGAARAARRAGTLVVMDLNARKRAWRGSRGVPEAVWASVHEADWVKASDDDLDVLGVSARRLRERMRGNAALVCTRGARAVEVHGPFGPIRIAVQAVRGVDTLGAGDAFTAALVSALLDRPHAKAPSIAGSRNVIERSVKFVRQNLDGIQHRETLGVRSNE